jgi:mRNA interferase YafQ
MYGVIRTKQFERSCRKLKKSGLLRPALKNEIEEIIEMLASGKDLEAVYVDHQLKGELREYRECHIRGDLLLVYQKRERELVLVLVELGSQSYLFG